MSTSSVSLRQARVRAQFDCLSTEEVAACHEERLEASLLRS